ncbi:limonene-1,2-epoxide hydrolase family protein [Actinocorallia longicatena]|uniref:Limonene-1,2-epoxide hydrolase family protein n=1 Tax=Actinocorallia longicatena TaxID=111803 RepID=A0ABP6QKH6_9ACTN
MTDRTPIETVRAFLAALESLDVDAAVELLADGAVYQNVPLPPARGRKAVERQLRFMVKYATGFEARLHHIAADGTTVLTERTDVLVNGSWRSEFWVCGTFETRDGKITLWRDYFDWPTFLFASLRGLGGVLRSRLSTPPKPSKA